MIAVIMSVYKNDNDIFLSTAIESILSQTINCDLFIYLDGILTDDLYSVIKYYDVRDNVFIFNSDVNKGLAYGLNVMIEHSINHKYEYIARMDSDDISRPERIAKQVNYLKLNPEVDVLGTSCQEFDAPFAIKEKHLPRTHDELLNFSITRCPFIHPSVMFRTSVFEKGFRYPEDTTLTEDMALWFLLLNNNIRFANMNEILLDYRLHHNTINRRRGIKKAISEIKIRTTNMIMLKRVNAKNIILISARVVFHLMPPFFIKLAYKKAR
ncbi:glycosyltransferase [Photobacterium phosphoreum]|uniref:glycosyltransferase n=1 Tax=Photobacterium phosphoreum TaxID=659 RepID=UPI0039B0BE94